LVTIVKPKKHFGEVRHEDAARSGDFIAASYRRAVVLIHGQTMVKRLSNSCQTVVKS